jgi:hypothetical protein
LKIHPIVLDPNLPPSSPDALLDPPLTPQKPPKASFSLNTKSAPKNIPIEVTEEDEELVNKRESRVGKRLSELTTKRVVILVLLLIFCVPLLQADYYFDPDPAITIGIQTLYDMSIQGLSQNTIETTARDVISMNKSRNLF